MIRRWESPKSANVLPEPAPRLDPALLDRAFQFSAASTLRLPDLLTSENRIEGLEIFPTYQLDLQAREDGKFDVVFRNRELDGWGPNTWGAVFLLFRGLPAQTMYPEFFNFKGRALNFTSMFRWDAEKRRLRAAFSGPLAGNPERHFALAWIFAMRIGSLYPPLLARRLCLEHSIFAARR